MIPERFEHLLNLVNPLIAKQDTFFQMHYNYLILFHWFQTTARKLSLFHVDFIIR